MEKTVKKVCQCVNCGNESEMMITCSLPEELQEEASSEAAPKLAEKEVAESEEHETTKVKGTAVCSHCGNEADMWIDI